jgi:hypothetical protein
MVEGETPSWWLWDSHEASPAEKRASSWSFIHETLEAGELAWRLGTFLP